MISWRRASRGTERLDVRLVALLGLALIPVGLIAMIQTYRVIDGANRAFEDAILSRTLEAVAPERDTIVRAREAARVWSVVLPDMLDDTERCSAHFTRYVDQREGVAFAGFIAASGDIVCGSAGVGSDMSDTPLYAAYAAGATPLIDSRIGRISGEDVIILGERARDGDDILGYVAVSVVRPVPDLAATAALQITPLAVFLIDAVGEAFLATEGALGVARQLDLRMEDLVVRGGAITRERTADGSQRLVATAPVIDGQLTAVSVWRPQRVVVGRLAATSAILFPFLMWLVSIGVAYFAVHRLVVRHVGALVRRIEAFAGERSIVPPPQDPSIPSELRVVNEAFQELTERLVRDEADLENALHEKDVLLKEVYHRVKNNLQLIASMTNMQIRVSEAPETRSVLRRLQDRVMGLATIHRHLYEANALSRVDAADLVRDLTRQVARTSANDIGEVDIHTDLTSMMLYPDQAVPLSLLLTEGLTNALKYFGADAAGRPWVRVALKPEGDRVVLEIENSLGERVTPDDMLSSTGLGTRLMDAFAMQLGGQVIAARKTDRYSVSVSFVPSDFSAES